MFKNSKIVVNLSLLVILGATFANCKILRSKSSWNSYEGPRVIRSADAGGEVGTEPSPTHIMEDAEIVEKIRLGLVRLRHAEDRLKQFVDKIELGIEPKKANHNDGESGAPAAEGTVDFHKLIAAYKDVSSQSFPELIKRISDDTHILLDQLHGRLDAVGHLAKGKTHDAGDTSAEQHHKH